MANRTVRARAIGSVIDEVGQNCNPAIIMQWRLDDERKSVRRSTHWLTDAALEYTVGMLRNAGLAGVPKLELFDGPSEEEISRLLPNEVELVLEDETNDAGKTYENVKYVNRCGATKLEKKHEPSRIRMAELGAKFKAQAMETAGTNPVKDTEPEPDFDELGDSDPEEFDRI